MRFMARKSISMRCAQGFFEPFLYHIRIRPRSYGGERFFSRHSKRMPSVNKTTRTKHRKRNVIPYFVYFTFSENRINSNVYSVQRHWNRLSFGINSLIIIIVYLPRLHRKYLFCRHMHVRRQRMHSFRRIKSTLSTPNEKKHEDIFLTARYCLL